MTKCTGTRKTGACAILWSCPLKLHCLRFTKESKPEIQSWIDAPFNDETYSCEIYVKVENEAYNNIFKRSK